MNEEMTMKEKKAIIVSYYRWWNSRQKYFAEWLLKHGYDVKFLTADYSHIHKEYIDGEDFPQYTERVHVPSYNSNLSFSRIRSNKVFARAVEKILYHNEPDVVICLIPSNLLCTSMAKYKKKHPEGIVIIDVLDCWPESIPSRVMKSVFALPFLLWKYSRTKGIKYADFIILECGYYKKILNLDDCNKCDVLYLNKAIPPVERHLLLEDCLKFAYLGSINNILDIDQILLLVSEISKYKKVQVKIIGKGSSQDIMVSSLEKCGVDVRYFGPVFEYEKIQNILSDCNFGLNILKSNLAIGLTTKSVDYFSLGLPIINSIQADTAEFVEKYNAGINLNDNINFVVKKLVDMTNDEYLEMQRGTSQLYNNMFYKDGFTNQLNKIMNRVINHE